MNKPSLGLLGAHNCILIKQFEIFVISQVFLIEEAYKSLLDKGVVCKWVYPFVCIFVVCVLKHDVRRSFITSLV